LTAVRPGLFQLTHAREPGIAIHLSPVPRDAVEAARTLVDLQFRHVGPSTHRGIDELEPGLNREDLLHLVGGQPDRVIIHTGGKMDARLDRQC
jgi:hypothetical protein